MNDMKRRYFILLIILMVAVESFSQQSQELSPAEKILAEAEVKDVFEKKFRVGVSWNQYWGTLTGDDLTEDYFAKPCIGFNIRGEYYPLSFLGLGAGFGIQQRGAGIVNPDNYGGSFTHPWEPNYDPDSTYRERLRMNTFEIPVTVLLRTPKDIVKGIRLSAAAGIVWINNYYVYKFFHKPEDGFHSSTDVSDDYIKDDLAYQASFGVDINAAESCIMQVHLVYTEGTKNVYVTEAGNGRAQTFGFRVAWLF
jgi:hypothetical protein